MTRPLQKAGPDYGTFEEHIVRIDADGGFICGRSRGKEALHKMFSAVEHSGKKRIVLYIHGGRVTMGQAVDTACRVGPVIFNDEDYCGYPIFICWESGDLSTYYRHLVFERNGISYHRSQAAAISALASPLVFGADMGRGAARLPINTAQNLGKLLQNSNWLVNKLGWAFPMKKSYEESLAKYVSPPQSVLEKIRDGFVFPECPRPSDPFQVCLGRDAQPDQLKFVMHEIATVPLQVTTEALLDSIATAEWGNMVRRTRSMFHPASNYLLPDEVFDGAGTIFFYELKKFLEKYPKIELEIFAHSMGSMVTNEAFAQFPDLRVNKIVFMAAACSIREFANTTGLHIQHCRTPFYNLSLHPRAELDEVEFFGVPVRGSLLTWIDEFFESPRSFGDRTLGTFENVIIAKDLLPDSGTIHLKAFPIEEGKCKKQTCGSEDGSREKPAKKFAGPQKHGQFEEYYFWRPDFRAIDNDKCYCRIPKTRCDKRELKASCRPGSLDRN